MDAIKTFYWMGNNFQKVDTSVAEVITRNAGFGKCYIPTSICYSDLCYLIMIFNIIIYNYNTFQL